MLWMQMLPEMVCMPSGCAKESDRQNEAGQQLCSADTLGLQVIQMYMHVQHQPHKAFTGNNMHTYMI